MAATGLIVGYRRFIGSQDVPACRFTPSCSQFTQEAIEEGGLLRGVLFGADRITRCHAFSSPQILTEGPAPRSRDPIPDPVGTYLRLPAVTAARGSSDRRITAGVLSAILPGAGKAYCGRAADGLQSLLMVGTAALLAYRGFDRDGRRSLEGWGAGSVGAVFYLGGILGAEASADLRRGRDQEGRPRGPATRGGSEPDSAPSPRSGAGPAPAGEDREPGPMAATGVAPTQGGSAPAGHLADSTRRGRGISPGLAVLASSLVPGSGQALAGSPGRGLNALLLNVALGAGAITLQRDGRHVEAALLFSLGFLRYYYGNLYWAARLAEERSAAAR